MFVCVEFIDRFLIDGFLEEGNTLLDYLFSLSAMMTVKAEN